MPVSVRAGSLEMHHPVEDQVGDDGRILDAGDQTVGTDMFVHRLPYLTPLKAASGGEVNTKFRKHCAQLRNL
jgi:hypothetical protein